jgi:nanoRNase/pAp phosphatase (c-di-AMP/oligoRNAs hydrolase)
MTPLMIKYLDDYDRWVFNLKDTRAFNKALWAQAPWTFERWHEIRSFTESELSAFIHEGEVLLKDHNVRVAKHVEHLRSCTIDGKSGLAVNAPAYVASDVAHELACVSGTFGMTYVIGADLEVTCSLRSVGSFDVSALAKTFGGGGHRTASGFRTYIPTLLKILETKEESV